MEKIYFILLWFLVLLCGGCAITEVLVGAGTMLGLSMVIGGLLLIVYIIRLPVVIKND